MTLAIKRQSLPIDRSFINAPSTTKTAGIVLPGFLKSYHALAYNERILFTFFLAAEPKQNFALIRGLIEFSRGTNFNFSYNANTSSIEVDISSADVDDLSRFLQEISAILEKEIRFKDDLKKVIAFEKEYEAKRKLVYAHIH